MIKDKGEENVCFPKYIENENPLINAKQLYHHYLTNPVKNNILIGRKNHNNVLITGPNAGGKSTFIKSLSLNVIFSQTLGISFCKSLEITPFSLVNTYLNIPDCKGKESLFEAEMHRARDHIKKLNSLDNSKFSFIVMDEIFNSTNPQEGISGAYAIAEKLATFKNSISIITTHFSFLTNLETNSKFKNYKIPIERDNEDSIVYPYKLTSGVSNQYIALELLRNKGFDNDLVNNAENICKNLNLANTLNNVEDKETQIESNNESNSESNNESNNKSNNESNNKSNDETQIDLNNLTDSENTTSENDELEFIDESDKE